MGRPAEGAGRPPVRERPGAPHAARAPMRAWQPVHVTLRVASHVWNLRSERSFAVVDAALRGVRKRTDFRVVHFSVQGNHLHLIVEANGPGALASGMKALVPRLARGLNRMMARRGPVFVGRCHVHVLRTPAEVRNALRYVLGNFAGHAVTWGERIRGEWVDPYSSASRRAGRTRQLALWPDPAAVPARTWLLRNRGVVGRADTPGAPLRPAGEGAHGSTRRIA
jgi:REP element-mobilizing transposase RayT